MYSPFLAGQSLPGKAVFIPGLALARYLDRRFVRKHVENIACISHTVRNRIQKVYLEDARVLYPPIHTDRFSWEPSQGYWLSLGRIDKWKRIHLQVEAFRHMPEKTLVVVGRVYPGFERVVAAAPGNVVWKNVQGEGEMRALYSRCEGFITTAIDEDFGITPLEAMASGKPVVAVREGGYQETVLDGPCGGSLHPTRRRYALLYGRSGSAPTSSGTHAKRGRHSLILPFLPTGHGDSSGTASNSGPCSHLQHCAFR